MGVDAARLKAVKSNAERRYRKAVADGDTRVAVALAESLFMAEYGGTPTTMPGLWIAFEARLFAECAET